LFAATISNIVFIGIVLSFQWVLRPSHLPPSQPLWKNRKTRHRFKSGPPGRRNKPRPEVRSLVSCAYRTKHPGTRVATGMHESGEERSWTDLGWRLEQTWLQVQRL